MHLMDNLLEAIEGHLARTNQAATSFSRAVMKDPNFVFDLRGGRDYRSGTAKRVMEYIRTHEKEEATR